MAKAILNGMNPYLPLPELVDRWIGVNNTALHHATPHPPIVGILSLPLAFFSYQSAALIWLALEVLSLIGSIIVLLKWWGKRVTPKLVVMCLGASLGWMPVIEELWLGQFSAILLLLLISAWMALKQGRDWRAGGSLGIMLALKLSGWPIVLFLLIRRRWKAVAVAGSVFIAMNLLPLIFIKSQYLYEYYFDVAPQISNIYRHHEGNFSTWTIGQRLFLGFGINIIFTPIWHSRILGLYSTVLVPIIILAFGLWVSKKTRNLDTAVGIMTIVGIWVNPIAWTHYLLLSVLPLSVVAKRIAALGWPKGKCYSIIGILLAFAIVISAYTDLAHKFAGQTVEAGVPIAPFAFGLMTLVPSFGLAGLFWMTWRSEYWESESELIILTPDSNRIAISDGN